jgi:hypothetical protein
MQLPRSGHLDGRRRRVLTDELIGSAVESAGTVDAARPSRTRRGASRFNPYGDAALADQQPRVMDLVPQRYSIIVLLFLAGLTAVAGLEALYAWMPEAANFSSDGQIVALDLAAEGSLASWFASTTLLLAAAGALLVYSIRRHKADDYQGRYRIWLWAAACWLAMSIDEGSSLHEGFKDVMIHVTGRHGFGDGSIWWIGAYLLVLGAVGTRLLLEMRACRSSSASLLSAAVCYIASVAAQLGWIVSGGGQRSVMIEEGCKLVGNLCLLLAMALHARFVLLAAQGLSTSKKAKLDKTPKPKKVANGPAFAAGESKAAATAATTGPLASKVASAKSAAPQTTAPAQKRSWFGRSKVDSAHAAPPPAKMSEPKSARTVTAAIKTDARKSATSEDYEFEYDDDDRPRKGGERRLSKAERKAMRRQQRERYEHDE